MMKKPFLILLSAALVLCICSSMLTPMAAIIKNYVINEDFESGAVTGWSSSDMSTHSIADGAGVDGSKAMKVLQLETAPQNRAVKSFVAGGGDGQISLEKDYEISFFIKADPGQSGSILIFLYANTSMNRPVELTLSIGSAVTESWSEIACGFNIYIDDGNNMCAKWHRPDTGDLEQPILQLNSGETIVSFDLLIMSAVLPTYYLDDFTVYFETEGDTRTVPNGDFEGASVAPWTGGIDNYFSDVSLADGGVDGSKALKAQRKTGMSQNRAQIRLHKDSFEFGTDYYLSNFVKADAGISGTVTVILYISSQELGDSEFVLDTLAVASANWAQFTCKFNIAVTGNQLVVDITGSNGGEISRKVESGSGITITGYYLTYFSTDLETVYLDNVSAGQTNPQPPSENDPLIKNGGFEEGNVYWENGFSSLLITAGGRTGSALQFVKKASAGMNRVQYFVPLGKLEAGEHYDFKGYVKAESGSSGAVDACMLVKTNKSEYFVTFDRLSDVSGDGWTEFTTNFTYEILDDAIEISYLPDKSKTYTLFGTELSSDEQITGFYFVVYSTVADTLYMDDVSLEKGEKAEEENNSSQPSGPDEAPPTGDRAYLWTLSALIPLLLSACIAIRYRSRKEM